MRNLAGVILTIAVFAGLIALQIYLSRMESRWPGLILPILSFVLSLTAVIGIFTLTALRAEPDHHEMNVDENCAEVTDAQGDMMTAEREKTELAASLPAVLMVLVLGNIPTFIYLAIYFGERQKYRKKRQMEKMNIQDLELNSGAVRRSPASLSQKGGGPAGPEGWPQGEGACVWGDKPSVIVRDRCYGERNPQSASLTAPFCGRASNNGCGGAASK